MIKKVGGYNAMEGGLNNDYITKNELIQYLKDNLKIKVFTNGVGTEIKILLNEEVISKDFI